MKLTVEIGALAIAADHTNAIATATLTTKDDKGVAYKAMDWTYTVNTLDPEHQAKIKASFVNKAAEFLAECQSEVDMRDSLAGVRETIAVDLGKLVVTP